MNVSMPLVTPSLVAHPELRRHLERYLRRRMPRADVEDTIQSVLCAALEARHAPTDLDELRKWITGIARHKIAAHYERTKRESLDESPEPATPPAPIEAASLARWAEREATLSEADHVDETLDWMAREADGERLE